MRYLLEEDGGGFQSELFPTCSSQGKKRILPKTEVY